jgi:hypothetical protein
VLGCPDRREAEPLRGGGDRPDPLGINRGPIPTAKYPISIASSTNRLNGTENNWTEPSIVSVEHSVVKPSSVMRLDAACAR